MIKGWGRSGTPLWRAGVALAALAPAAGAWAQTNPTPANPPPATTPPARPPATNPPLSDPQPQPGQDDIVVTAPSQQSSIDRQTYLVRDTPEARSTTTLDLLARIPSIEVQADGSVRLVGAGTANILVDGRRVQDPATFLRNLQGSQIERVEVMTNPGAAFPAQGTGGIVNIITRRNYQNGLGGSATATVGRFGQFDLRVAPTYGTGNWTFSGNAGYSEGEQRSEYERERFSLAPAGPVLESSEEGRERGPYRIYSANGSAGYRPDDRNNITLTGNAAHADFRRLRESLLTAASIAGGSADQNAVNTADIDYRDLGLDYRGTSARQGELLTASVKWTRFDFDGTGLFVTDPVAGAPTTLRQASTSSNESATLKADYVRPMGGLRRLSFGAQLIYTTDRLTQAQTGDFPFGTGNFSTNSLVRGSWIEHAGYVSYQFGLAGFTILPGIRVEGREYDLNGSTGVPDLETTHIFPSLFLERRLAQWLTADASYSRRITYPQIQQLDPAINFSDATTAQGGNPLLRPQLTDSFETKLHATIVHHNIDLTIFRRETDGIWSQRSELNADGVLVTRPFNFGTQSLTGGEIAARGPLARGLRYVLTTNVADQALDRDGPGPLGSRHNTTWSASGQLEYKDGTDGRRGADRVNLSLRYFGPFDTGFVRGSAYASASLTWSHFITDRLSSVLTIQELRLTPPRELISTSLTTLSRDVNIPASPRITFSLTWSFRPPGQGPQVRQQQQSGPAIPVPQ